MKILLPLTIWLVLAGASSQAAPATGPLVVSYDNPRYFADRLGRPVYLAGAHDGWELQDYAWGDAGEEHAFDWIGFLNFLSDNHHNVIRFWSVEHTKIVDADAGMTTPMAYRRVEGKGRANDGGDKFDLDQLNPEYFDRLRERSVAARDRGIYVIVMLFQGWSIEDKGGKVNPWPYHPFNVANNVNGVNGDVDGNGQGSDLHTWLGNDHPITQRQWTYVRHVIDTLNDLDNVLYEISNESHTQSIEWQNRMVDFIHAYEGTKPKQHPVGITVPFGGARLAGLNGELFASRADWISPNSEAGGGFNFRDNPPPADGRKVVLLDSDHLYGSNLTNATWAWKSFFRGYNVLFMDRWTEAPDDPARRDVRRAIGRSVDLARQLDLANLRPMIELASTRFCLANPGHEYVVYAPDGGSFTVDLSVTAGSEFTVRWLEPGTGKFVLSGNISAGANDHSFTAPFTGSSILHLKQAAPRP